MELINPFDVFSVTELGEAMRIIPNTYGLLNEMGLFPVKGLTTTTVAIEEQNGVLTLLPTAPRGAPGTVGKTGKRKMRTFAIPQIPHNEGIEPDEVQGVRAFGQAGQQAALEQLVLDKQTTARSKHDITLEYMRAGALRGIILDGAGNTIYNLYTEFGIAEKVIDFAFTTATTDIRKLCLDTSRYMEDNLLGDVMSGVKVLTSPEFFDSLTNHATVKAAYANYADAAQRLGGDMRKGFIYGGLNFEEYRGVAPDTGGTPQKFIAASTARAFPLGTRQTFRTFCAPADFNETVGQMGQLFYAKIEPRPFQRGYDMHTQSNPLPMCIRPNLLVKFTMS